MLKNHWIRVLKPNGILAMIIPNAETLESSKYLDKDHKHAWSAEKFRSEIIEPLLDKVIVRELNTLGNNFSYNVVLRKKDTKRLCIIAGEEEIGGCITTHWDTESNQIPYDDKMFIESRVYDPGNWLLKNCIPNIHFLFLKHFILAIVTINIMSYAEKK